MENQNITDVFASSVATDQLSVTVTLSILCSSLIMGLIISLVYKYTNKNMTGNGEFYFMLILLPGIISIIILLIGSNIARAFSLAGAFSLIRFRSTMGSPKDMAYIFFVLGVGLACGMGYIFYAALLAIVVIIAIFILNITGYGNPKDGAMALKIMIPEDLNYIGVFDNVLRRYTTESSLKRVRTQDFGSLFELNYEILMRDTRKQKQLLDEIRTLNGNLLVSLTSMAYWEPNEN